MEETVNEVLMKMCYTCNESKTTDEFHLKKANPDESRTTLAGRTSVAHVGL